MTSGATLPIRLLLVDDEEDLVTFLSHRLRKRGVEVTTALSGREALAAVDRQIFDVAVLDLKMPDLDGITVMERLKAIQPFTEVLMLTGHGSHDSAWEAGRLQAFRYLLKPYKIEELLEQIQEAYELREDVLNSAYEEEMMESMSPGHTPKDILARCEELRRKYDRN